MRERGQKIVEVTWKRYLEEQREEHGNCREKEEKTSGEETVYRLFKAKRTLTFR